MIYHTKESGEVILDPSDKGVRAGWTRREGALPSGAGRLKWQDGELVRVITPTVITLSKLKIRLALREMGKEAAFDAFLDQSGARPVWTDAQVIMSDDDLFTTYAPQVKSTLSLTNKQFATLLACKS